MPEFSSHPLGALLNRRTMCLGAVALSAVAARAQSAATIAGVRIGCSTYTFSPAQLDQALEGIVAAGFAASELHPRQIEPSFEMRPVFPSGPGKPDVSAEHSYARDALRQWRLKVPLEHFTRAGQKFRAANVTLVAYNMNYGEDFSDAEIDRTFEMAKALGTDLITAVGPTKTLRRLDAFARSHRQRVAFHNEEQIPDVPTFEAAVAGMSDYIGFNLDIGHFTSTGGDSMAMLKKHGGRIWDVHLKDQKKNLGPVVAFGQGDSPIAEVLRWVRDTRFAAPVNIEQEAPGWDREKIARQALDYCRKVLSS
jgi:sugar phosphate isomerase/epimerase